MEYLGNIRKMESRHEELVEYFLPLGSNKVDMNGLIGTELRMEYQDQIHCIKCGRETKKSFAQGFCYPCFTTAPETEECVLRPELCRAHEGVARDMAYAEKNCLTEQVVYLSLTSGLKVGVTRFSQVPTRWIDQGALQAIILARTPNRYSAGKIEVALKSHIQDKTNWRRMLSGSDTGELDMLAEKNRFKKLVPEDLSKYLSDEETVYDFHYPVQTYPEKIKSLNFDKEAAVSGILTGIKGQYLMFNDNRVINMRKFGGYLIRLSY